MENTGSDRELDFLRCVKCSDFLRSPKILDCGHDICESCLSNLVYVKCQSSSNEILESRYDGEFMPVTNIFKCPDENCQKDTKVRANELPVREWATLFYNDTKIINLLQIFQRKKLDSRKTCDVCLEVDRCIFAVTVCVNCKEFLCLACHVVHRHVHPDHKDISLKSAEKYLQPTASEDQEIHESGDEFLLCRLHPAIQVSLFCKTCLEKCCKRCRATKHNTCKEVSEIGDLFKTLTEEKHLERLVEKLETLRSIVSSSRELLTEYDRLCEGVGHNGDDTAGCRPDLEHSDLDGSKIDSKIIERFQQTMKNIGHIHERIQILDSMIDGMNEKGSKIAFITDVTTAELFINDTESYCDHIRQETESLTKLLQENASQCHPQYGKANIKDICDKCLMRKIEKTDCLSDDLHSTDFFRNHCVCGEAIGRTTIAQHIPKVEAKILLKTRRDEKDCWLTDCLYLKGNIIVAADNANKKIKVCKKEGIIDEISLDAAPWSLTVDTHMQGYVSLPEIKALQLFKLSNEHLVLENIIRVGIPCTGLSASQDRIAATLDNDRKIAIFDLLGNLVQTCNSNDLLKSEYLTWVDEKYLLVSSFRFGILKVKIDEEDNGAVKQVCPAPFTTGIALSEMEGSAIVCMNNTGKLCLVKRTEKGLFELGNVILHGLDLPRAVSWLRGSNSFAVTVDSGSRKNYVYIYDMGELGTDE